MSCFPAYSSQQKISISTQQNSTHLNYIFKKQRKESRDTCLVCRFQKVKLWNAWLSIVTNVTIPSSSQDGEDWDYVQKNIRDCTVQWAYLAPFLMFPFSQPVNQLPTCNHFFSSTSPLSPYWKFHLLVSISYLPAKVEMSNTIFFLFCCWSFELENRKLRREILLLNNICTSLSWTIPPTIIAKKLEFKEFLRSICHNYLEAHVNSRKSFIPNTLLKLHLRLAYASSCTMPTEKFLYMPKSTELTVGQCAHLQSFITTS